MLVYNIGLSAVRANQSALQAISNNIANANTVGYHRQQVNLAQSNPITQNRLQFGTGVMVSSIQRVVNSAADSALTLNLSQSTDAEAKLEVVRAIEGLLTPASGSLTDSVSTFFNGIERLAASPAETTIRREVIAAAQNVAQQISSLNSSLDQLQQQQLNAVTDTVSQINQLTSQIAAVEKQIRFIQAGGTEPNTLLDQRDQLVQDLSKLVDISPGSFVGSNSTLVAAGGWMVVEDTSHQLSVTRGEDGSLQIMLGSRGPVEPVGGKLAGLLAAHNEIIPSVRETLQSWTSAFVSGVNSAQATGLGLTGPVAFANGFNSVSDATVPLSQAGTLLPVDRGSLFVSVTNTTTGDRQTYEIPVDPDVDSLQDVMNRLNAIPNLNASVSTNRQARISADSGYALDFAGRPDSTVDLTSVSGTAVPVTSGIYKGNTNANWTVTADSSGQVGATSGLKLRVSDSVTGALVSVIDVGSGYVANQPIEIAGGLSIRINAGTFVAGDQFQIQAVTDPDSSGFLNALGIGGLFQTTDLRSISVDQNLISHPELLAASRSGETGDASQLERLIQFRGASILSAGTETVEARLASITSNTGLAVNSYEVRLTQLQSQYDQIRNQQDATSGVDPNEELMSMLQFQRAFQANARFISSINEALDQLLGILR